MKRSMGMSGEALTSYNTSLGLDKSKADVWDSKSKVLIELGKYDEAIKFSTTATDIDPFNADAWSNKATLSII